MLSDICVFADHHHYSEKMIERMLNTSICEYTKLSMHARESSVQLSSVAQAMVILLT